MAERGKGSIDRSRDVSLREAHILEVSPSHARNSSATTSEATAQADERQPGQESWREGVEGESRRGLSGGTDVKRSMSLWKRFKDAVNVHESISEQVTEPLQNRSFGVPGFGRVTVRQILHFALSWVRQPQNFALLVWGLLVGLSGAVLFFVMIGALNSVLSKTDRQDLFEVCSQTLNALFTFMCLMTHPERILAAFRLHRWREDDIRKMRKLYCKGGVRKPNEWLHMLVLIFLLNLNCLFQYCLAGLNWGYNYHNRPAIGVAICFVGAFGCAAAGGVYATVSPLGRDYGVLSLGKGDSSADTEDPKDASQGKAHAVSAGLVSEEHGQSIGEPGMGEDTIDRARSLFQQSTLTFAHMGREGMVEKPVWKGGLFSCCDDVRVCVLTMGCFFCVFGQNMHRLHFGNGYVQTVNFLIFFFSPYLLFILFAVNIHDWDSQVLIGCIGVGVSLMGLSYGGYWRRHMRHTYRLPPHTCCGRSHNVADILLWILFPCCSLCQEVRTAEAYHVLDGGLVEKPSKLGHNPDFSFPNVDDARHVKEEDGSNPTMKAPIPEEAPTRESQSVVSADNTSEHLNRTMHLV